MYVKFTRLDGSPIWINAAFIVTVEPRKLGGSVVVPIGDGLDYDVRETTDQVLKMLEGAPEVTVVPVPPPKGLAPTPEDVSPEVEPTREPEPSAASETEPPHKTTRSRSRAKSSAEKPAAEDKEKPARKPRVRTAKKAASASTEEPMQAEPADVSPAPAPAPVAAPAELLSDEQIERIRRMAPRSLKKLTNTIVSQFRVSAPEAVIEFLAARGVLFIEQGHVSWH